MCCRVCGGYQSCRVVVVKLEAVLVVECVCGTCTIGGTAVCGTWNVDLVPRTTYTICAWYFTMQLAIKYNSFVVLVFSTSLPIYRYLPIMCQPGGTCCWSSSN
jgi:hypothetical protein